MAANRWLVAMALAVMALGALGVHAAAGASPPAPNRGGQISIFDKRSRVENRDLTPAVGRETETEQAPDGVGPLLTGHEAWPRAGREAVVAAALPQFEATDLAGRRWTAADLRGRVLLIDFWATWCAPCLADLPRLQALWHRYPRSDFEILGISLDATSRRSFVSWLNRHRVSWPQVHERQGYTATVPRLFGIEQLPSTVVIDRNGQAVAVDARGDRLVAIIDALVTGGAGAQPDGGQP